MALTVQVLKDPLLSGRESVTAKVTFDNSYATGGLTLLPAALGLKAIAWLEARQEGVASRICEFDYSASKLKLFTALATEAANASDQSSIVIRVIAFGPNV